MIDNSLIDNSLIVIAAISLAVILFLLFKKNPQRVLKKNKSKKDGQNLEQQNLDKADQEKDHKEKPSGIRPESDQQRNLDREVGGLEESETLAADTVDPWDDRLEEIVDMEDTNQFKGSAKESMIWEDKEERLEEEEQQEGGLSGMAKFMVQENVNDGPINFESVVTSQVNNQGGGRSR